VSVAAFGGMLSLDGQRVPLLSGEVHFWRHDPASWEPILARVVAEGIPIVATYLSWRRHEPLEGTFDFDGRTDPRLDVRRFLELCARHGLLVHLKPGPWICAEEAAGGYPAWLLADPSVWERDVHGRPVQGYNPPFNHPVPAYLHPRYLEPARRWLGAVGDRLADLAWPAGPIAMVQLDNEPSHCFRDNPLEAGHHPLTQATYRQSGRRSWADFQSWLLAEHLRRLRSALSEHGLGDLLFTANTNEHRVPTVPQDPAALRLAIKGIAGEDLYYQPPLGGRDLTRVALAAALALADESPLPWAPEIQAGIWRSPGVAIDYPDPTPNEQRLWYHAAFAFGLRGLNFYMLADRENWDLAPIGAAGQPTAFIEPLRDAVRVVKAFPEWGALRPVSNVALAWRRHDLEAAWSDGGLAARRTLVAFSRLVRGGNVVAIWDVERAPKPALPVVDPLADDAGPAFARPAVAAAAPVLALLQRGGGAEALFVLNPRRRATPVTLRFADRREGRLIPVADDGPPLVLREGRAGLTLAPLGTAVFRVESPS